MSVAAPPMLKPSFNFLLNAAATNNRLPTTTTTTAHKAPTNSIQGTSNTGRCYEFAAVALYIAVCVALHICLPHKVPAALVLATLLWRGDENNNNNLHLVFVATVAMMLLQPVDTPITWLACCAWPMVPSLAHPVLLASMLLWEGSRDAPWVMYAMTVVRGAAFMAMKAFGSRAVVVLFTPSPPSTVFAVAALFLYSHLEPKLPKLMEYVIAMTAPSPVAEPQEGPEKGL